MAALVRVTVLAPDDILAQYGAGAVVRVGSATTEAGVYAEITPTPTIAVVAGVFSYELAHPTGTTTTWYRTRYSNSANNQFSDYSDSFTASQPDAYANLDDLLLAVRQPITDTKFLANAEQKLLDATEDLDGELHAPGRYFRSPRSGADEVREFTVGADGVIHAHGGIVSITSARMRTSIQSDFETLLVADLRLEYWAGGQRATSKPANEPWDHVRLTGRGTTLSLPRTAFGIEFTGAYQFPVVPRYAREATVALARQRLTADPSVAGVQLGEEGGSPMAPDRWPRAVYDLLNREARRFMCAT